MGTSESSIGDDLIRARVERMEGEWVGKGGVWRRYVVPATGLPGGSDRIPRWASSPSSSESAKVSLVI